MASDEYHFITQWRVEGSITEVADILNNAVDLPRWWPSVYLDVHEIRPGDQQGVGRVIDLYTKGWLPYTLRWQFTVTAADYPYGFTLRATGDFDGTGIWTLMQAGSWVDVTYDWRISVHKPMLRRLSFALKPIFAANHRWAMSKGEDSLRLEMLRRRASTAQERAQIPPPPQPTTVTGLPMLAGLTLFVSLALVRLLRTRRQS